MGAYRVLDESYDSDEIVEYVNNLYFQHSNNGKHEETRFSGSLNDLSLPDLINSFGRDKVSGVLRVYTPYCSGKIISLASPKVMGILKLFFIKVTLMTL